MIAASSNSSRPSVSRPARTVAHARPSAMNAASPGPTLAGLRRGPLEQRQAGLDAPALHLDDPEVVGRLGAHLRRRAGVVEDPPVGRGGLDQPPGVQVERGLLVLQLDVDVAAVLADEGGGPGEVPLGGVDTTLLVADRAPCHQRLAPLRLQAVPAGRAHRLVEHLDGAVVGQPAALEPPLGAQRRRRAPVGHPTRGHRRRGRAHRDRPTRDRRPRGGRPHRRARTRSVLGTSARGNSATSRVTRIETLPVHPRSTEEPHGPGCPARRRRPPDPRPARAPARRSRRHPPQRRRPGRGDHEALERLAPWRPGRGPADRQPQQPGHRGCRLPRRRDQGAPPRPAARRPRRVAAVDPRPGPPAGAPPRSGTATSSRPSPSSTTACSPCGGSRAGPRRGPWPGPSTRSTKAGRAPGAVRHRSRSRTTTSRRWASW